MYIKNKFFLKFLTSLFLTFLKCAKGLDHFVVLGHIYPPLIHMPVVSNLIPRCLFQHKFESDLSWLFGPGFDLFVICVSLYYFQRWN
jgi:hypothetical protein